MICLEQCKWINISLNKVCLQAFLQKNRWKIYLKNKRPISPERLNQLFLKLLSYTILFPDSIKVRQFKIHEFIFTFNLNMIKRLIGENDGCHGGKALIGKELYRSYINYYG